MLLTTVGGESPSAPWAEPKQSNLQSSRLPLLPCWGLTPSSRVSPRPFFPSVHTSTCTAISAPPHMSLQHPTLTQASSLSSQGRGVWTGMSCIQVRAGAVLLCKGKDTSW